MSVWSWLTGQPQKSPQLAEAERAFTAEQLHDIQKHFSQVAGKQASSKAQLKSSTLTETTFLKDLCHLPPSEHLSQCLVNLVKDMSEAKTICLDNVIMLKARLERKGEEETRETCFSLLLGTYSATQRALPREELKEVVASAMRIALKTGKAPDQIVEAIVVGALHHSASAADGALTHDAYVKWCKVFPAVLQVLRNLMLSVGVLDPSIATPPLSSLPQMIIPPHYDSARLMLQPEWAWALQGCLPADCQQTWRLLFNSVRDGKSFSTFMGKLGELAPTLLLLHDKAGHLLGGFATQPWQRKGAFYGDAGCFIFGLMPKMVVYPATSINANFQWCGVNFSQLPNGVGLGGQVGHYGVFVDSTFDSGISRPIATFANDCLASAQTFEVEAVECWLLKPPEDDTAEGGGLSAGNTVLERNQEARNFMELAGVKVNHSEGVRAEPPPEMEL